MTKNILICVTGLSPQIITETLYALVIKKKIVIDELYIFTTERGKNVILGKDKQFNVERKYPAFQKVLEEFYQRHKKLKPVKFKLDSHHIIVPKEPELEMYDVRNDEHNILFPNRLSEFIREKTTSKENVLHCSISGGRKTMSVDMAMVTSLFARENDKLYHVLVDEKYENDPNFWYPKTKAQEKCVELSEIPFVKLRIILGNLTKNEIFSKLNYAEVVELTQKELKKRSTEKLIINTRRREMYHGEKNIEKVEPKQIELYRYLLENNASIETPVMVNALINILGKNKNTGEPIKAYGDENVRQTISKLNKKINNAVSDEIFPIFKIQSGSYGEGTYYLEADKRAVEFRDD